MLIALHYYIIIYCAVALAFASFRVLQFRLRAFCVGSYYFTRRHVTLRLSPVLRTYLCRGTLRDHHVPRAHDSDTTAAAAAAAAWPNVIYCTISQLSCVARTYTTYLSCMHIL
jgi:hypothetical protein